MHKLTATLCILFIALLGFSAWFYFGGTLRADPYIQTADAADYPEAFSAIRSLLDSDSAPQILGNTAPSEDPAGYILVNITVTLHNRGLFPAEWLHASVKGAPGDIAVYAVTGEGSDIAARDSGQINLKLITTAPPETEREISIQYYVHGMKRTITTR